MSRGGAILARAVSDEHDRLISAEEPLAGLQIRCGGSLPGTIAVPGLLEAVRKSRQYQLKLAQAISAHDGDEIVTAWIESEPQGADGGGCDILVRTWRSVPLPTEDAVQAANRRNAINRHLSSFTARLDARQSVLAVECCSSDLAEFAAEVSEKGIGRPWTDFVTVEGTGHRQPMHWRLLDGAQVSINGSQRSWHAYLIPHAPPGFDPVGFELLLVADQPLVKSNDQPESKSEGDESDKLGILGEEVAPVLRRPLSRIIADAQSIRSKLAGPLASEYADYAGDIATAGQHLMGLLDDLADLEVVESESFRTVSEEIDLADAARKAAAILGVRAKEKGIVIDAPKVGEIAPAVGEFRRVLQILLNLIGNAVKYAPEGSQVWVRLSEADGFSQVIVADQGPGLNDAEQAAVFEKFERLGRSGDGGSGLGLYISRRLANAMKGDLTVESAPGHGARFILELPMAKA